MLSDYKNRLLEMLNYLDAVCTNNKIRYFAIGGTFLGAIRHKGFIPWDDDIDVCMPRPDYEKFQVIVNNDSERYIVETPQSEAKDYCYSVAKLYDTTTTLVEDTKMQTKRGVYIDVFPLDGIGNSLKEVIRNYMIIDFLNLVFAARTCIVRPGRGKWKNFIIRFANLFPSWAINEKKLVCRLDKMCSKYKYEDHQYVGVLLTQYRAKYIMPKQLFEESRRYPFENTTIMGVKDYETYLHTLFGEWRILPPKKKQIAGHDFSFIDLNQSYLEKK